MAKAEPTPWHPRRSLWLGLGLMLLLAAAPHLPRLPLPAALAWCLVVGWRLYLGLRQRPPPGRWTRLLLLLLTSLVLWAQFGTLLGREAGSSLLVLLLALKFLELKGHRDVSLLVFLAYFLLLVQLLFDQSPLTAGYLLVTALLITTLWVEFSDPTGQPLRQSLRLAGTLLLQALPLMLVLFLLFPRIPGPLWNLPRDAHGAVTGLSNEMEPGRISALAQSEAVAFRVSFEGEVPPPAQRYWRGPVLDWTDGRRWTPAGAGDDGQGFAPRPLDAGRRHWVTLEPHGERSLLALDRPATAPPGARLARDYQLLVPQPIYERRRYAVTSHPRFDSGGEAPELRARARQLPPGSHPRLRALAGEWRRESPDPEALITRALQHFNRQPFVYTLNPPRLGPDPMDEFLFETRRGFCEHYAAAFTLLMRAAGLPARVVTGYLGGELNPVDRYLVVRQSDAHAWAEVWLEGEGWRRVDPTAAVAPERVERGILPRPGPEGEALGFRVAGQAAWLRHYRDALGHRWNQWVLGYGPERQRDLLRDLGLGEGDWPGLVRLLVAALLLATLVLAGLILYRPGRRADPAQRLYEGFCRKLARRGVTRRPGEGPRDFARRAAARLPGQAARIEAIGRDYIRLRYREAGGAEALARLRARIRAL